ncbi:hypothetical protein [Thiothrix unzii]|uniref:Uncharacterized protein n=1 Tax=Thiothrix unzii TaxID=111769 RepID=A0A975F719_9GAMM|nr:hypothetical protein [Thiothrix unzii]QTR52208.1 hypothetical protein J9260_10690 [Thiothrix unzii]
MVDRISNNFFDTTRNVSRSSALDTKPDKQLINKFEKNLLADGSMNNDGFFVSNQIITPDDIKSEGGTACDGKGGFKEIISSGISDECGIHSCYVQHEQIHISQLSKYAPKICEGQAEGKALGYLDNASAVRYERPAYKDTIKCLEEKMDDASLLCKAELKIKAFQLPGAFNVIYREKL